MNEQRRTFVRAGFAAGVALLTATRTTHAAGPAVTLDPLPPLPTSPMPWIAAEIFVERLPHAVRGAAAASPLSIHLAVAQHGFSGSCPVRESRRICRYIFYRPLEQRAVEI